MKTFRLSNRRFASAPAGAACYGACRGGNNKKLGLRF